MNTLTHQAPAVARWHLARWAARAWHKMGWRHVLLAFGLYIVREVFGVLGGIFFLPFPTPPGVFVTNILNGSWVVANVAIVYGAMVANEAFDDGVPPLRAYGCAVIVLSACIPPVKWFLSGIVGWPRLGPPQMAFGLIAGLFQLGLGFSIYAYWRVTQRSVRQAQAAETERARNEQRVQVARLLALQSRVEPQMLFDALGRVGALHVREPQAADALLADLIALLRAMLPGAKAANSTVEREFALVGAWLRVTRHTTNADARVELEVAPDAQPIGIAPMLVLPLARSMLALPRATQFEWLLKAETAGDRLIVMLQTNVTDDAAAAGLLASVDLSSLHDRLGQLFGNFARLTVSDRPPALTLDLPRLPEDHDDDSADR